MGNPKRVKIVHRKLGREKALGLAHSDGLIEIDPRQPAREWLDTIIHELLHMAFPEMSEEEVAKSATFIAAHLWRTGVRRLAE